MEQLFARMAGSIALAVEAAAVLIIGFGACEAFVRALGRLTPAASGTMHKKEIWVRFAVWLLLGLEFELAADVIRTAIAPSWTALGQLGAIAAIRTVLNFFLERDIAEFAERSVAA
jgi:uncharacterized membrane protein